MYAARPFAGADEMSTVTEKTMNSRQRIMAVLEGKKPDRVPWVPLVGRYYIKSLPEMGLPIESFAPMEKATGPALRESLNLAEIEILRHVGADILRRHVMVWKTAHRRCKAFERKEDGAVISGFETPKGTIWERREEQGGTEYISRHMLESTSDIDIFLEVIRDTRIIPFYDDFLEFEDYIGDDGISSLTGPVSPIQELLQFKMGVQNTSFALIDEPDKMEQLFSELQRLNLDIYQVLAESPAKVAVTYDDTSTTVMSPDWYRRYCMDELDQYSEILHKGGLYHIAHMCGKISLLTDDIKKGAFDGVDSVCPPTTGDLEPGAALEETGKIIIGGLEPPALVRLDSEQVLAYVEEKLAQVEKVEGGKERFMLCTGDSTAAGTPVENLKAISRYIETRQW
jgi:uroporphyrinogen-III decarboxylase